MKDSGSTDSDGYSLDFDTENYSVRTITVNEQDLTYRAYEGIVYVKYPVDTEYHSLNIFVPEAYYSGESINGYTVDTAPVFFPNGVGGYMPALPKTPEASGFGPAPEDGVVDPNAMTTALKEGFIVVSPGTRGRTLQAEDGTYYGKAPAAIVDLKAAVRYLKYNNDLIPGDSEKIFSNGTSAGGALSALLGASGDNPAYLPYLEEIGAADASDAVYGVSAYCPITNLENTDAAYEWYFNGYYNYKKMVMLGMIDFHMERKLEEGTLTEEQIALSRELADLFPEYLNSLGLRAPDGSELSLDSSGYGSFRDYLKSLILESAQKALDAREDLSGKDWITISGSRVTDIDFDQFRDYVTRMKLPPAFDGLDLTSGENDLFGTETIQAQHFTSYSLENSAAEGTMADEEVIALMNAMNFIGDSESDTASFWRVRHGAIDSDTALAIPTILSLKLDNEGYQVDYAVPWDTPHSGDYDLDELFDWMKTAYNW